MNTEHYKVLIQASESGNITKLAEKMGYTQSGVSKIISRMEKELSVKLINRTHDGISWNEEAYPLLDQMKQILAQEELLYQKAAEIADRLRKIIRIGCFQSVSTELLPGILQQYIDGHSDTSFEVMVCDEYEDIEKNVQNGIFDLAFTVENYANQLVFIPLFRDCYYAIVNRNDKAAANERISLEELVCENFMMPNDGIFNDEIMKMIRKQKIAESAVKLSALDDTTTISMVSSGMGRSIVPGLFLDRIQENVKAIPICGNYYRTIGICITAETDRSGKLHGFIEYCRDRTAENRQI